MNSFLARLVKIYNIPIAHTLEVDRKLDQRDALLLLQQGFLEVVRTEGFRLVDIEVVDNELQLSFDETEKSECRKLLLEKYKVSVDIFLDIEQFGYPDKIDYDKELFETFLKMRTFPSGDTFVTMFGLTDRHKEFPCIMDCVSGSFLYLSGASTAVMLAMALKQGYLDSYITKDSLYHALMIVNELPITATSSDILVRTLLYAEWEVDCWLLNGYSSCYLENGNEFVDDILCERVRIDQAFLSKYAEAAGARRRDQLIRVDPKTKELSFIVLKEDARAARLGTVKNGIVKKIRQTLAKMNIKTGTVDIQSNSFYLQIESGVTFTVVYCRNSLTKDIFQSIPNEELSKFDCAEYLKLMFSYPSYMRNLSFINLDQAELIRIFRYSGIKEYIDVVSDLSASNFIGNSFLLSMCSFGSKNSYKNYAKSCVEQHCAFKWAAQEPLCINLKEGYAETGPNIYFHAIRLNRQLCSQYFRYIVDNTLPNNLFCIKQNVGYVDELIIPRKLFDVLVPFMEKGICLLPDVLLSNDSSANAVGDGKMRDFVPCRNGHNYERCKGHNVIRKPGQTQLSLHYKQSFANSANVDLNGRLFAAVYLPVDAITARIEEFVKNNSIANANQQNICQILATRWAVEVGGWCWKADEGMSLTKASFKHPNVEKLFVIKQEDCAKERKELQEYLSENRDKVCQKYDQRNNLLSLGISDIPRNVKTIYTAFYSHNYGAVSEGGSDIKLLALAECTDKTKGMTSFDKEEKESLWKTVETALGFIPNKNPVIIK